MRGKEACRLVAVDSSRITPAYAGKRVTLPVVIPCAWDHPRVCGEKTHFGQVVRPDWGSPPRMRGKAHLEKTFCNYSGITPAYAGKRAPESFQTLLVWDHPRVCGEKILASISMRVVQGSPPRMRGKVRIYPQGVHSHRITPAYAGKSKLVCKSHKSYWDHPRVCGEKMGGFPTAHPVLGSPPRMRGKAYRAVEVYFFPGITPAYAGKRPLVSTVR